MNPLKMKSLSALISSSGKQAIAKAMNVLLAIALIALAAGAGLVGGPAGTARAATFDVTRFDDPLPDGCVPGDCSLREALLDANATAGADTINLPAGTYSLTLAGAGEDAGAAGDLDVVSDVTLVGQGAGATVDAALLGDRVFHVIGAGNLPVVSISSLTITGGLADNGGGLLNAGGAVTLTASTVINNSAISSIGNGGGLYNTAGTLTVIDSILSGNSSQRTDAANPDYGGGGAIYNGAGGTVTVEGVSSITGNTAVPNYGGGIYNQAGTVSVTGSIIAGNVSDIGGGIFNLQGSVTLADSEVSNNAQAGLYNLDGTLTLDGVGVIGNVNAFSGGGGLMNAGGTVEVDDSTLMSNSAGSGGGIFNRPSSMGSGLPGTMTLTNSSVTNNTADSDTVDSKGGGIWNYAQGGEAHVTLIGSMVSDNLAVDSAQGDDRGGGIFNGAYGASDVATLTLIDSFVSTNAATDGGGIYNDRGQVDLSSSTVDRNTAGESGGGVYTYRGAVNLAGSTVDANSAGVYGGGLYNLDGLAAVDLTIADSTISNNTAVSRGGGLYNNGFTATMDHATFSGNSAVDGGGLYVVYESTTLTNSTVSANSATGDGGGLNIQSGSTVTLTNSTVADNSSDDDGAGLYLFNATADVTASTFSGNSSSSDGGGLFVGSSLYGDSAATVVDSTVSGNSADDGAGLYVQDVLNLSYSTVGDNIASTNGAAIDVSVLGEMTAVASIVGSQIQGADCNIDGASSSIGYNLESGSTCGFNAAGDLQSTDPLLLPLADNGGPTLTHALSDDSPAIDAADPVDCKADTDGDGTPDMPVLADQRGEARYDMPGVGSAPPDQVCDIGAYEYIPLVVNGSFEEDLDANGMPDSWIAINRGPNDGQGCILPAHSGPCFFRLLANGSRKSLNQIVPRAGPAGDSYTLSVWSSGFSPLAGSLVARVRFNYADGTTGVFTVALGLGTYPWTNYTVVATAAQDYDSITVGVISTLTNGLVGIDDVTLIQN